MDRLLAWVQRALNTVAELDTSPRQTSLVVEVRNTQSTHNGTSHTEDLDGEEVVSLLVTVLSIGLQPGLTSWDVISQLERLPDFIDVFLAPLSFAAVGALRREATEKGQVPSLSIAPELAKNLSGWANRQTEEEYQRHSRDAAALGGQRPAHGIATKFLKNMVAFVKNSAGTPHLCARMFFRCALNMGSLTAVIEALAGFPDTVWCGVYDATGFFRDAALVNTLLEAIAPIGGLNLRVRAAADLFEIPFDVLTKQHVDPDSVMAMVHRSGASESAETMAKASPGTMPDAENGVAYLCSLVNEARGILKQYTVTLCAAYGHRVKFSLQLELPTDRDVDSEVMQAETKRRADTLVNGNGIVVQRRRAGTLSGQPPLTVPAANPKRTKKKVTRSSPGPSAVSPGPSIVSPGPSVVSPGPSAVSPGPSVSPPLHVASPPKAEVFEDHLDRPLTQVQVMGGEAHKQAIIIYTPGEKETLDRVSALQSELDKRVQGIAQFISERSERELRQSAVVEPLLQAYERLVHRLFMQRMVQVEGTERETMELLDVAARE